LRDNERENGQNAKTQILHRLSPDP